MFLSSFEFRSLSVCDRVMAESEKTQVKCETCQKVCKNKVSLKIHVEDVHSKLHKCDACEKYFQKSYIKAHIANVHTNAANGKVPKCEFCGKGFNANAYLKVHIKYAHGDKQKCDICKKQIGKNYIKKHINIVHKKKYKTFKCELCGIQTTTKPILISHISKVHEGLKEWQCKTCDKFFSSKSVLHDHIAAIHEKVKNVKCTYCEKTFPTRRYMKSHERIKHLKDEQFSCETCPKYFSTKNCLKKHIKNVHAKIKIRLPCDTCGKDYNKRDLRAHIKITHEKKEFKCELCDKEFALKRILERHVENVHTKIKDSVKFNCGICNKQYTLKDNLAAHVARIHQKKEKSYGCDNCEKKVFLEKRP